RAVCVLLIRWICRSTRWLPAAPSRPAGDPPSPRADKSSNLWVLKPVVRPDVPAGLTDAPNPIDAFVAAEYTAKRLTPVGPADRRALLRRVFLDLTGLPPAPGDQDAFAQDQSPGDYEKGV